MKKFTSIFFCSLVLAASNSFAADGGIVYGNTPNSGYAPIFDTDMTTGLKGSAFKVALYYGAQGNTDANSMMLVAGTATDFHGSVGGLILGNPIGVIPGASDGDVRSVQLRAWEVASGTTWETASVRGESIILDSPALGDPQNAAALPRLEGLQSFHLQNVNAVPEPSTVALGIIGGLALLMRRRRS